MLLYSPADAVPVAFPGPSDVVWGFALLGLGALLGAIGESIRTLLRNRIPLFQSPDWVERVVLDTYLGVGAVYVIALLPIGWFYPLTAVVLLLVLGPLAVYAEYRRKRRGRWVAPPSGTWGWAHSLAVASALTLFVVELVLAEGAPAGNTYDASLYSIYSALALSQHSLPFNLSPIVSYLNPYPQGSTGVFATAAGLANLPPPRISLLVTPLFFALAPLGGFVWGRRWLASAPAGAAFAVSLALVGTWTRYLAAGSNDFILAFPLVLLLLGWVTRWTEAPPIGLPDTLAFGGIAGIAATLNPVGSEWLLLLLPVAGLLARPRFAGRPLTWATRWLVALGTSLVLIMPSLVIAFGLRASGSAVTPQAAGGVAFQLSRFVAGTDPFLFGPGNVLLSPFPALRAELAVLLVVGVVLLLLPRLVGVPRGRIQVFGRLLFSGFLVAVVGLLVLSLTGVGTVATIQRVTSSAELAILLSTVYLGVASFPLALAFARLDAVSPPPSMATAAPPQRLRVRRIAHRRALAGSVWVSLGVALIILTPGVAVTATSFPVGMSTLYRTFGNLTEEDFGLLEWASGTLPDGARVLMAPGSAAQFLPGYDPRIVPVYSMAGTAESPNGSYRLVINQLFNATLDAQGVQALDILNVQYIAVTQVNTALFPAFSPVPLVASPQATAVYHMGDAWLFAWAPATTP